MAPRATSTPNPTPSPHLGEHVAHVRLGPRVLGHLLDPQVHHEREVVPQVVLVADVVLEAHRVLAVEGVAVDAAHEAHVVDVVLD